MITICEPLNESIFPQRAKGLEAPHVQAGWNQDIFYTIEFIG